MLSDSELLLLKFTLNDDLIFHYVCLSLGGLVPGGGVGMSAFVGANVIQIRAHIV